MASMKLFLSVAKKILFFHDVYENTYFIKKQKQTK